MASSISFAPPTGGFTLRLKTSAYFLRVLPGGEFLHGGFTPLPPGAPSGLEITGAGDYKEPGFSFDLQVRPWEYPTFGDVSYHETALKAAFAEPPAPLAPGEASHLPVRDVRLRYHSHEVRTDAEPLGAPAHGQAPRVDAARETLCVRLKDAAYDFWATLFYRVTPEHDLIERWVEIENRTNRPVDIDLVDFGVLHLPAGRYDVTHVAGAWAREFIPVTHALEQGTFVLDQRGLNTGHASNPFFLIHARGQATEDAGTVFFGAVAWSGNWRLRFESQATGPHRVFAGYEASDFALPLAPGERHTTPAVAFGCSLDGLGGASRRMHRFIRERVLPDAAREPRPVLYNSWEAMYFGVSLENQTALAKRAAAIGVELFVLDDGWFGARRHDHAGLGDWTVSPEAFPGGLRPLADEVRRLGMKFGLWVEPEMVNADSDLYRAHPDWVLHFPGRPRTEARHQLVLDFGRREVVEYLFNALDALVRENGVEFFKWDMNRYATEPGSVAGREVWRRHVEGFYSVVDRLRAAHPSLEVQSCSGGGGRVDLGVLARVEQVWTSDNTDAHDRTAIQDGFSLMYPPCVMESWVTHTENHQTGRLSSLDLRFDVAMRGALGIGSALDKLPADELEEYRRKIAFYKTIRPVVQEGDLYRLSTVKGGQGASVWQIVLPDASRAVYSTVVLGQWRGVELAPVRLRALTAGAVYAVTDEHGEPLGRYPGWQLMMLGLPDHARGEAVGHANRSRTVLLERV